MQTGGGPAHASRFLNRYVRVSPTRMQVRSAATRIAEIQHLDTHDQREKPVGHQGTYVQCESVSLSRDIPTGLGWLIGPFVTSIPREALEFTLQAMRRALSFGG